MKRFTILIDMDDTLESLLPAWVQWLNDRHGLSVDHESISEWDMHIAFPSLADEELFAPLSDRSFWKTVMPKPNAPMYVKKLIDDGHKVYVCTASHYSTLQYKTEEVLFKYFPYLKWENVIVAHDKYLIKGDVIIDDALHNLEGRECNSIALLMDAPHNRNVRTPFLDRVHSWEEIYQIISRAAVCE